MKRNAVVLTSVLILLLLNSTLWGQTTPGRAIDRARNAHGSVGSSEAIQDWTCQGTITLFKRTGPTNTFPLTIIRKRPNYIQQIINQPGGEVRYGSDGRRSWQSFGSGSRGRLHGPAQGEAVNFIEANTLRSVQSLFNYRTQGLILSDLGIRSQDLSLRSSPSRVIQTRDRSGRRTRYFIDHATALITRLEFDTGESRDGVTGRVITQTDTYVFSDFRNINGIQTPFKVERYRGRTKTEELQFSSVRYNVGIREDVFKP